MRNETHLLNYLNADLVEAGCDEAGRGPLAGPVFAAAVILPKDFHHPLLNDSKKMTEKARETLRPIIEQEAIAWAVEEVSAEEIDTINILNATHLAMRRAVEQLDQVDFHRGLFAGLDAQTLDKHVSAVNGRVIDFRHNGQLAAAGGQR